MENQPHPMTTTDPQDHAATDASPSQSLPPGWVETTLGEVVQEKTPQRVPKADEVFFYIDITSVDRTTKKVVAPQQLDGKDAPSRARKEVFAGDVIVSMTRPNLNAVAKIEDALSGQIASTGFDILRPIGVSSDWIFNFVRSPDFVNEVSDMVQGALYPAVKSEELRSIPLALPPLPEQKRIADKLDALLDRVEAARERLERVPKLLKTFRQSVLSAAVSGELTRDWRGGEDMEWEEKALEKIAPDITYGYTASSTNKAIGPKMLRITDIQHDSVNWETVPFCEIGHLERQKYLLKSGDLVFARTGATVGKSFLIRGNIPESIYASYLIRVRPSNPKDSLYLKYFFQSLKYWNQILDMSAGIGQPNVNGSKLKSLLVPIPPVPEQAEIVRRVEALFALTDRVEARYTAGLAAFERLTPALLQKAFRGELVPQDPADEPASVLLERIRAARAAGGDKPKRGRGAGKTKATAGAEAQGTGTGRRGRPKKGLTEAEAVAALQARKAAREAQFEAAPEGSRMPDLFGEG